MMKTLIYGYGNLGRQDDGLAHAFIEAMEEWVAEKGLTHISFEENYQLNIEDAEVISNYELVLFVDASLEVDGQFKIDSLAADSGRIEFTMHAVSPSFVLDLCQKMFGK